MRNSRKIGLICSPSYPMAEMLQLSDALGDAPSFVIADQSVRPSNHSNVHYLPNMLRNPIALVAGILRIFSIVCKEKPGILFAEGSRVAIPFFYFGKFLFRAKLIFIEYGRGLDQASWIGRLIYPIADVFIVKQEAVLKAYGSKARHARAPSLLWEISDLEPTLTGWNIRRERSLSPQPAEAGSWKLNRGLQFPTFTEPVVSIIIPVHNQCEFTVHCLRSILENTGNDVPYEILIADDGSTDETSDMLERVKGIRTVVNANPLGFLRNCNRAATFAKGKYILFLNNDTYVTRNWLRSLVETAERDPGVGMVGSKLVFPDGTLQEAGGIVWNDPEHTAWNHGRNDDPEKYDYNFLKEADYCSAACVLIRKEIFDQLKGFDERYTFAYYEDADLAFSVRRMGFKVVFQPQCEVIHFEGASHGKDLSDEGKSFQLLNQKVFYEKWRETLEAEHFKTGENVFLARDRSRNKKVMLYIDHYVPTYDKDAGSYITYEYLKIFLNLGFKIIFWPNNLYKVDPYTSKLQQMGVEVVYGLNSFRKYIQKYGQYVDIAILSRPDIAINYMDLLKACSKASIVYVPVDLHFLRKQREAELRGHPNLFREVDDLRSREFILIEKSDMTWVYSTAEKELIETEDPGARVDVSPWIQAVHSVEEDFRKRTGLVFIAGFAHPPNEDGILWFAKEVFPLLQERIAGITLTILGSNPTERIEELESDDIKVLGFVTDPAPYFNKAKVFISPLRYGAGLKGKILNAMSHGLPVVSTSIGIEGMGLEGGRDALVADDAEGFAEKVVEAYQEESLWKRLSENGMAILRQNFSAEHARKRFEKIFTDLRVAGPGKENAGRAADPSRTRETVRVTARDRRAVEDSYRGFCTICGNEARFSKQGDNLRETFACNHCGSNSRNRHLARVLCSRADGKRSRSLRELIQSCPELRIYETQASGAIHSILKKMKQYECSEFFPDVAPGSSKDGVRCEDLEHLSYPSGSFDVVITQDVLEHVRAPWMAFKEIHRVLEPGGFHIFTIPYHKGSKTLKRIQVEGDRDVYLLPKVYHGDGVRDGLVYTDFGEDIPDLLDEIGFTTDAVVSDGPDQNDSRIYWSITFVSGKKKS